MKPVVRPLLAGSSYLFVASNVFAGGVPGVGHDRQIDGGRAGVTREFKIGSRDARVRFGTEVRRDDIDTAGLYRTHDRQRLGTIREDGVVQTGTSVFVEQEVHVTDLVRVTGGLRHDYFDFNVDSNLALNSGKASDSITSPKIAVVVGPWNKTELFLYAGRGFH
ncbi:MAG: TonB-dependent receptor [Gammaproteobacteria bacterium]